MFSCFKPPADHPVCQWELTVDHSGDIPRCMAARDRGNAIASDTIATSSHAKQPDIDLDAMLEEAKKKPINSKKMKFLLENLKPQDFQGATSASQACDVLVRSAAANPSQEQRQESFYLLSQEMPAYLSQEDQHKLYRNIAGPRTCGNVVSVNGNSRVVQGREDSRPNFCPDGGVIIIFKAR